MRHRTLVRLLGSLIVLTSSLALAEGKDVKEKAPPPLNEIEHGAYLAVTAGFWSLINPPAGQGSKQYFSPGQSAQMEIGYDFNQRLSVGIFAMGTANHMGADYTGKSQDPVTGAPLASGDFTSVVLGANARVSLIGFDDSQDVKRTWVYIRAGAGFVLYQPKALLPGSDVLIYGGPGIEYFTKLRHFSIGVEVDILFMALNASIGFTVTPMLRYAF